MTFCAGCGSPNLDTDATCRVCARSLTGDPTPQPAASPAPPIDRVPTSAEPSPAPASTATAVADAPAAPAGWTGHTRAPSEPERSIASQSNTLPASAVATPSGFESLPAARHEPDMRPANEIPSFLRPTARPSTAAPSNESASLISEHDLPDWIRQIAADDARKLAEAQVQEAASVPAAGSSMPSHFGRRALPGETHTSGPAMSSWLSRKNAVAGAAESAWDVTGAAPPSRPVMFPDAMPARPTAPSDAPPVATDVVVAETVTAPSRRRRRGSTDETAVTVPREAIPTPSESTGRGNATRVYLLAAIVLVILVAAAMTIL